VPIISIALGIVGSFLVLLAIASPQEDGHSKHPV
jgi:hypothetical protein